MNVCVGLWGGWGGGCNDLGSQREDSTVVPAHICYIAVGGRCHGWGRHWCLLVQGWRCVLRICRICQSHLLGCHLSLRKTCMLSIMISCPNALKVQYSVSYFACYCYMNEWLFLVISILHVIQHHDLMSKCPEKHSFVIGNKMQKKRSKYVKNWWRYGCSLSAPVSRPIFWTFPFMEIISGPFPLQRFVIQTFPSLSVYGKHLEHVN